MVRKMIRSGMAFVGLLVLVAGLTGGVVGCEEEGYYGVYDTVGYYGDDGYSAHDQIETTLGNFVDYGDGVSWTYEP